MSYEQERQNAKDCCNSSTKAKVIFGLMCSGLAVLVGVGVYLAIINL